jgi:antitoxin component of MazEF toxin-antitoxin module
MTTKILVKKNSEAIIPAHIIKSLGIAPGTELEIDIRMPSTQKRVPSLPDIPPDKTVQDFLNEFEQKYQMTSEEFYRKLQNGELDEDPELNEWAIYYSIKLELEEKGKDPSKATFEPVTYDESYA